MRPTPRPLLSCALICGLLAGCSASKGPATSAYLREFESDCAGAAGQVRGLPGIPPPSRPSLPPNPTDEEQRVFDGTMRIYPLFVNQYYGAIMERCQALSQISGQAQDRIAAMNAAGVDPAAALLAAHRGQVFGQWREFFTELRRLADLNRTALVRRKSVDDLDVMLSGVFSSAIAGSADGGNEDAAAAAAKGLKAVAGAASGRQGEQYGIGDQVARVAELAAQLQGDAAACLSEHAGLAKDLQARYPDQDWGMLQAKQAAGAK